MSRRASHQRCTAMFSSSSGMPVCNPCHTCVAGVSIESIAAANRGRARCAVESNIFSDRFSPGVRCPVISAIDGQTRSATSCQCCSHVPRAPLRRS